MAFPVPCIRTYIVLESMGGSARHLRYHPRRAGDLVHSTARAARFWRVDHAGRRPYHGAMPHSRPSTTLFEDAIDVPLWLENDRAVSFTQRCRRDRDIGSQLVRGNTVERVRGWWHVVDRPPSSAAGVHLRRTRTLVTAGMVVVGAVAGIGIALAAFHYDGTRPVNVVTLLAALVLLPLLLLLSTLLLIPGRVPGLGAIQDTLAMFNSGAVAASVYRRLVKVPRDLAPLFGWHQARSAAAARFAKWQLLYWSQAAAVGFFAAAITTGFVLVTFTDLAFGWSTTLAAEPGTIEKLVRTVALPWHHLAPSAVPDLTLIARSQFYRLDGSGTLASGASRALTGWWPFTILTIVTYGALPRLAVLLWAGTRLRAATRALLLEDPRVTALLDRMATPAIETAAAEPEQPFVPSELGNPPPHDPLVGTARAVIWSASLDSDSAKTHARKTLGLKLSAIVEAGGGRSLEDDHAAIKMICNGDSGPVIVFTRAWEPPVLEFLDFIGALRRALGAAPTIIVNPVAETTISVDAVQRETWSRAIARLADPHLYLETGAA